MILGVNPLAIGAKPQAFVPWKDSRCVAWFDAAASQTVVGGRTTAAPSLKNPLDVLTVPVGVVGPLTDTSIGGQPTWIGDPGASSGAGVVLSCPTFAFPEISGDSRIFFYAVMRGIASGSGFNTTFAGGPGLSPSNVLGYAGGYIQSIVSSASVKLYNALGTPPGNYLEGTPKRLVQFHSGTTGGDLLQWGSTQVTGTTSQESTQSGVTLFARGQATYGQKAACAFAVWGLFTGDPATGNLLTRIDDYCASRWTTNWAALVS
jgi:hypothetical protein